MFSEKEIRNIYNGFEKKDLPFEEFRRQVIEKTDPARMVQDAMQIVTNKCQINRGINHGSN